MKNIFSKFLKNTHINIFKTPRFYFNRKTSNNNQTKKNLNFNNSNNFPEELVDNKEYVNENIYLKILSCLEKLGALDNLNNNDNDEKVEKLKEILEKYKNYDIKDEEIIKMIKFQDSGKYFKKHGADDNTNNLQDEKYQQLIDYTQKIVNEELSEEEYAESEKNDLNIRFKRPPHTLTELKNVIQEAEEIYDKNKNLLLNNEDTENLERHEKYFNKIPNYLVLRSLSYQTTDSEIILVGVKRNSNLHALYLSNLLKEYKPDLISIHLPPDLPLFISAEGNYKKDWKEFVVNNEKHRFLINPIPNNISEMLISVKKIEKLFDENFVYSDEISISPKILFSHQSKYIFKYNRSIIF
jgi:hypothetical protein